MKSQHAVNTAAALIPPRASLPTLREVASTCTACDLHARATQTVFGEGARHARVMFVGEQPGDQEDLSGRPFVGPAGKLFDRALAEVPIDRGVAYVTNVVKHFKWEPRGKRRIHQKPNMAEITACLPWLHAEITAVRPEVLVCLGSTAAQALLGRSFKVTQRRGVDIEESELAPYVFATVHPSSLLRTVDPQSRAVELKRFVDDLKKVAAVLG